ncbi:hypothetical protein HIC20_00615 [Buchnera aphidicola (Hormaphis cornu)]|nr:hypothetical protein HIC20_00615 [Buchnera aphidicola (Hormaphis cornu)]
MIKFTIEKEKFLDILQNTAFLLIRKNSSNILQNILIQLNQKNLFLTICNFETEFIIKTSVLYSTGTGKITVSGKKLLNICRTLPNSSIITIETVLHHKLKITTSNSYFELLTQPANDFPNLISFKKKIDFSISEKTTQNNDRTNSVLYG